MAINLYLKTVHDVGDEVEDSSDSSPVLRAAARSIRSDSAASSIWEVVMRVLSMLSRMAVAVVLMTAMGDVSTSTWVIGRAGAAPGVEYLMVPSAAMGRDDAQLLDVAI